MTVEAFAKTANLKSQCMPCPEKEVSGVYMGDLLSWVMGKAEAGDAWITIMSNVNVIAVASLSDVSCVILAEGVTLDEEILSLAVEKGINVLLTESSAYKTATSVFTALK